MFIASYHAVMIEGTGPANSKDEASVWRGPTIAEIAAESHVGTATVDRVLNGRSNVREATRQKVFAALERLKRPQTAAAVLSIRRIAFLSDSGASFNRTLGTAVADYAAGNRRIECSFSGIETSKVDPIKFANLIERSAGEVDGLVIVAREDLNINRAVRNVVARKTPVVCLTTDLPASGRHGYVGSDATAAGSVAAYLMGQVIGNRESRILLVYSAPYRAQEEREMGFRRVLRSEFPKLAVDERVSSNDDSEFVYQNVVRYIEEHGEPAGIYNVAGGNLGVGRAIEHFKLLGKTVFIGHELNPNSRLLLESGNMNFVIGHDVFSEVETAANYVAAIIEKHAVPNVLSTHIRIFTKYSCN